MMNSTMGYELGCRMNITIWDTVPWILYSVLSGLKSTIWGYEEYYMGLAAFRYFGQTVVDLQPVYKTSVLDKSCIFLQLIYTWMLCFVYIPLFAVLLYLLTSPWAVSHCS